MTWANPGMLGFLALGAIPLIIYLINRQRYQRRPWAAMEFLLRAMKKHRRRLRVENLLLLLIRTAAVLLFVLAMARPTLESGALPVVGGSGRSELFLIDRSYSMALQDTGRSTLRTVADIVRDQVKSLSRGDRVGLIYGGGFPDIITREPEVITEAGAPLVLEALEEAEIVHEPLDVAPLLAVAADWIASEAARGTGWVIHLYSDLQRQDWTSGEGTVDPAIREALGRLEERGARVFVHPAGEERPRNVSITAVRSASQLLAVDLPTQFLVSVVNEGREAVAGIEVELWIDEEVQGSRRISVEPGSTATVAFPTVFRSTGPISVRAAVRSDQLEVDNERFAVFEVRESFDLLVVDGSFDASEGISEADWLIAALGGATVAETGVRLSPYSTTVTTPDRWTQELLDLYRGIIFVDPPEISAGESEKLEAFLADGGGVLFFPGDRFRREEFSANAYREGEGWFPFDPAQVVVDDRREIYYHWIIEEPDHPTLEYLADTAEAGIADVAIHGFVRPRAHEGSTVLMTLDDADRTPALLLKEFGLGATLASITGAGRRWSNFPITPAYLPFLYETLPFLVTRDDTLRNLAIGEPFRRIVPSEEYSARVLLVRPGGDGVPLVLEEREDRKSFDLSVDGQSAPGAYEIRYGGLVDSVSRSEWFAVNVDPSEGNLAAIPPEELVDIYPWLSMLTEVREDAEVEEYGSGDLWMPLLWSVLLLILLESFLARIFGRRRLRGA